MSSEQKDIKNNEDLEKAFQKAVKRVNKSTKAGTSNEVKLNLYGVYKQALFGNNTNPEPTSWFGISEETEKWKAWTKFKGWSPERAKKFYIELVKMEQL